MVVAVGKHSCHGSRSSIIDIRCFNWSRPLILGSSCLLDVVLQLMRSVECLDRHDLPQLQLEVACALINVASRSLEHTRVVIDHGTLLLHYCCMS
ncbi:importin subunit alpha-like [Silene latifolia]|uniref:importin subunit alpha-like n=1 Tax=Silene latifolia TaxID=37657 RepID=UPI003D76F62D